MKTYFALSEHNNGEHIGVVAVPTDVNAERLEIVVKNALESHFDAEVLPLETQIMEEILSSYKPSVFGIKLTDDSLNHQIEIVETYIYE